MLGPVKEGDEVIVHYTLKGGRTLNELHTMKVKSVGRKWATLTNGVRFDIEKGHIDGGNYSSPGRCYSSMEEYRDKVMRVDCWMNLRNRMGFTPPEGVTLDDIRQAAKLLGMEIPAQ